MENGTSDKETAFDELTKITLDFFWKRHCPWCLEFKERCKCERKGEPCRKIPSQKK